VGAGGSQWKTCGRQGRGAGGSGEVWKAVGKCGRDGKAREVTGCYNCTYSTNW